MKYRVVGVIFEITKKRYFFEAPKDLEFKRGDMVIVDTARGQEIGKIYAEVIEMDEDKLVLPLKPVLRKARKEDVEKNKMLKEKAKIGFETCNKKIAEHNLLMKLIVAEYTYDESKLIFYFTAEGRVDFRDLVKSLASIFKLRIELRQIGVRDEARILGCTGICGRTLCCQTFINKFDSVSIKMARDQGLVINPSKISGTCGRLLCCIRYEFKEYERRLKDYPAIRQRIKTNEGKGVVLSLNPLNDYIYADIEGKGVLRIELTDVKFDKEEAMNIKKREENSAREHKQGKHGGKHKH